MRPLRWITPVALVLAAAVPTLAQDTVEYEATAETSDEWAEFIRPSDDELAWERIGWRPSFWPAVEEARRLGRPILLWTMNGHPLGCT